MAGPNHVFPNEGNLEHDRRGARPDAQPWVALEQRRGTGVGEDASNRVDAMRLSPEGLERWATVSKWRMLGQSSRLCKLTIELVEACRRAESSPLVEWDQGESNPLPSSQTGGHWQQPVGPDMMAALTAARRS